MLTDDDTRREVTLPPDPIVLPDSFGDRSIVGERLPVRVMLDDTDRPIDVVDVLALEPFSSGREPFARSTDLDDVRADATLLPPGAQLARQVVDDRARSALAVGPGWTLRYTHWLRTRRAEVVVTAVDDELARSVLEAATRDAVHPAPARPDHVTVGFWHLTGHGVRYQPRSIQSPVWDQIRGNYPQPVAAAVSALAATRADDAAGRVLLLHGPPGTGKTTLLRSLAHAWKGWCRTDCVLDPDRLFSDPSYLLEVTSAEPVGDEDDLVGEPPRWRLLVLEDCDELVRAEAKAAAGQALSRLLNLTDGMLGQGTQVLVAITTNERLSALHPAVLRPGRCMAQLEVGPLSPAESAAWLQGRGLADVPAPPGGATLAELYALAAAARGDAGVLEVVGGPDTGTGLYL